MANGIGRVWAANAGDDEQRPNGVGSVWIENIDALAPSGGASEEQINELSAAIDYVSANAGDPNALTGYQTSGVNISATKDFFEASGAGYDLNVGYAGHLTARYNGSALFENSCSAVFTNGSKFIDTNNGFISADGSYGFYTSGNTNNPAVLSVDSSKGFYTSAQGASISGTGYGIVANTYGSTISSDFNGFVTSSNYGTLLSATTPGFIASGNGYYLSGHEVGFNISSRQYNQNLKMQFGELTYSGSNISSVLNGNGLQLSSSYASVSAGIGNFGGTTLYANLPTMRFNVNPQGIGWSNTQNNSTANIGGWQGGIGYSGQGSKFEVCQGSNASITQGGILEVHGNGTISAINGGRICASNGASTILDGGKTTYIFGANSLLASGSQFISADGEGVSAWRQAPMVALGQANQTSSNAAFVIGNGTANTARSDLFVIDYSGNAKSNDFIAAPKPIVHTVTGELTATQFGSEYYYSPLLSSELGIDLTKVSFSVDFSELGNGSLQTINYHGLGSTAENNWYTWNNKDTFKQNFEQPFSTSSTFTGYSYIEGDPTSLTAISSIDFVLDTNITIPYTATWTEEVAPKSFMDLYNAFTAYTASHP